MRHTLSLHLLALAFLASVTAAQAEPVRLPKDPALSPDGSTLAFAWHGDIWRVPVAGGTARQLTRHRAVESSPAFSPDGQQIAFASDRDGSRQIYVMPADGGTPRRITWHTEGYGLQQWMPDGKNLLVSVTRDYSWSRDPRFARLALVSAEGRRADQLLFDDYAGDASISPNGRRILFTREGEVWWRQGYHGARASQIWLFDRDDGTFSQIEGKDAECRWPMWRADGQGFYYVSNRAGTSNLWERDLTSGEETQRTSFATDAVVYPSISRDGRTLVFRHSFDFYRWRPQSKESPTKIDIECAEDSADDTAARRVLDRATSVTFTRDGLQMALVAGGDVWVMDTELREPRQVTHTAEEERDVVFAPDGKSLWFVSDAGGQTDIWKAVPAQPAKAWWENVGFTLTRITNDASAKSRIRFSPDGKHIAYVKDRGDLWLADADGGNAQRIIESWNAPDYRFSPEGSWIVYSLTDEWFNSDIWLKPVDGSRPPFNLSRNPDHDSAPIWSPDGKLIAWTRRNHTGEVDIQYVWLRAEDDERTRRERTIARAREKFKTPSAATPRPAAPATEPKPPTPDAASRGPEAIEPGDIFERIHRIAIPHGGVSGLVWSPDSKRLAFTATIDGKHGTYTIDLPDDAKPKLLAEAAGTDTAWIKNDDHLVCLSTGVPTSISSKGVVTSYRFRALQTEDRAGKQRAVFDQCWRTMRDHYYDETLNHRDWNAVRQKYADTAATAPDMRSVVEVVQLMLGELNGSHLGFTLQPTVTPADTWREETAHLGMRFDPTYAGPGWLIRDVLEKGPASHRNSRLEPGEIILKVDGQDVTPATDASAVLNGPIDRDITLRVRSAEGTERDVTLRPITYTTARQLLYEKWIRDNRNTVEKASNSTLGYLHISKMDDASFERFLDELYAAGSGHDGLIIDVRENGGGSTTDHLLTALNQPRHAIAVPRGGSPGYPDGERLVFAAWTKPIAVLCNQNSYSNAEVFSHAIKTLKRGKLIGVPTAGGVISTGATSIMDVGTLRLPFRGWYGIDDGQDMELNGAQPDFVVWPKPGDMAKGIDAQLQKAIEVLQADVAAWKARPKPPLLKAGDRKP